MTPDKYKIIRWFNRKTNEHFYGIDARVDGDWCHVIDGEPGSPVFFPTEKEAKEWKKKTEAAARLEKEGKNAL